MICIGDYKVSKDFGMDISFEELVNYNTLCKIDLNSTHHFESFEGILIYVSHPNIEEKFTIELGVTEDGFIYEGDYGCRDDYKEIPIEEGLKILEEYRKMINAQGQLEFLFLQNNLDYKGVISKAE